MPSDTKPLVLTFKGGLNLLSDETAVADDQLTEAMNFDQDLDGSLKSRPPFADINKPLTLGTSGQPKILGWFYNSGVAYLIASDGLSKTWAFNTTSQTWIDTGATYSASAMVQFDDKAWLLQPGVGQGGGYWTGSAFTADANMPRGTTIAAHKSRLWIARGKGATNGGTIYYSDALGSSPFWPASPDFQKIGFGDGQDVVYLISYYQSLIIFRTESIWSWQYTADPAAGVIGVIVPGVGLQNEDCVAAFENAFYFMYDNKAYAFVNNRAEQLNAHVPFESITPNVAGMTAAVSIFNRRVLFAYYDVIYAFNLNTQTWTRWRSTTYGSVSQVTSSANDPVELAYALKSAVVGPETFRYNELVNPSGRGPTTGYSVLGTGAIGQDPGIDTYAMSTTGGQTAGNYGIVIQTLTVGIHLLANTQYTFSVGCAFVIDNISQSTVVATIGSGVAVSGTQLFPAGSGFTRRTVNFTTGDSGYVTVYILGGVTTQAGVNNVAAFQDAQVELSSTFNAAEPYFSGSTADTQAVDYSWAGAANNSRSSRRTVRLAPLLRINDTLSGDQEEMQCILQTKNYSYQLASNYKRLFWWGADARFRRDIHGSAVPVVYTGQVTWGSLKDGGVLWSAMLNSSWGSPYTGDTLTQVTDYDLGGVGVQRKFVKFRKSLRFRQIYFRLVFNTDGSISQAPVQLFNLTCYVSTKQTVSKAIT